VDFPKNGGRPERLKFDHVVSHDSYLDNLASAGCDEVSRW
jgi:hypothetical protein